ncbi:MAG: DegV family EDD domain-containing protein [Deltaproteobacteria bacterium]|nr:DegV family EDD domain-containing protein [Deltaproteobacteria bacterium]
MKKVGLITDSASCISRAMADALHIRVIQNYVVTANHSFRDHDLDLPSYYAGMRVSRDVATTSHASMEEVEAVITEELSEYETVLYMAVSPGYTQLFDMASNIKEHHPEGNRIRIVNTEAASGQMAAVVLEVAAARRPESTWEDLESVARGAVSKAREIIVLDSLTYLARGGRIGRVRSLLGLALSIKPLIGHLNGIASPWGKVRTHAQGLDFILKKIQELGLNSPNPFFLVSDADNAVWAENAEQALKNRFPAAAIHRVPMAGAAGTHMGPGTWSVAWISG